jgi:hypothetical protein
MTKPWHEGRRFFTCPACCARDESLIGEIITTCWVCGGKMDEWVPPAVQRERDEGVQQQ